ncbi:uncharacterized protein ASCRUDRAFT_99877 [Ascoidea rubescens DSM 1968]|uniref:Uncharacterized protein n=1 Tax=Ascoidea rubescens DSM 1968 TaxID=1344418 RepID=A0A1D2VQP0_9ASCO|nr:hypothetical protein ASCRUDRAFT_99877 [Ascoidea rubescens DSM 1968]ODV63922.1 hypothetical protein ASCRUDRAFT_99877 [Ascoidea rubescens DSM 1968]
MTSHTKSCKSIITHSSPAGVPAALSGRQRAKRSSKLVLIWYSCAWRDINGY